MKLRASAPLLLLVDAPYRKIARTQDLPVKNLATGMTPLNVIVTIIDLGRVATIFYASKVFRLKKLDQKLPRPQVLSGHGLDTGHRRHTSSS